MLMCIIVSILSCNWLFKNCSKLWQPQKECVTTSALRKIPYPLCGHMIAILDAWWSLHTYDQLQSCLQWCHYHLQSSPHGFPRKSVLQATAACCRADLGRQLTECERAACLDRISAGWEFQLHMELRFSYPCRQPLEIWDMSSISASLLHRWSRIPQKGCRTELRSWRFDFHYCRAPKEPPLTYRGESNSPKELQKWRSDPKDLNFISATFEGVVCAQKGGKFQWATGRQLETSRLEIHLFTLLEEFISFPGVKKKELGSWKIQLRSCNPLEQFPSPNWREFSRHPSSLCPLNDPGDLLTNVIRRNGIVVVGTKQSHRCLV